MTTNVYTELESFSRQGLRACCKNLKFFREQVDFTVNLLNLLNKIQKGNCLSGYSIRVPNTYYNEQLYCN